MSTLKRLRLPNSDLEVSRLCLGAGGFGTHAKGDQARRLVSDLLEAGGNFFDTAHCYAFWIPGGEGASERELGACIRDLGCRESVVVATKGGHPEAGPDYPRPDDYMSERMVTADITESLERLEMETIDLYYLHRDDTRMPVGEIIEMMDREVKAGRIRSLGVSNWSVDRIAAANAYAEAHGLIGIAASQPQWSLAEPKWPTVGADPMQRYVTPDDTAWYASTGLPIVAYSATGNGYFAGRGHERGAFATSENAARYERARELAAKLGRTPTQIDLAYLLCQQATVIPLFSTGSREHLKEGIEAADIDLTPDQVRWLCNGG